MKFLSSSRNIKSNWMENSSREKYLQNGISWLQRHWNSLSKRKLSPLMEMKSEKSDRLWKWMQISICYLTVPISASRRAIITYQKPGAQKMLFQMPSTTSDNETLIRTGQWEIVWWKVFRPRKLPTMKRIHKAELDFMAKNVIKIIAFWRGNHNVLISAAESNGKQERRSRKMNHNRNGSPGKFISIKNS